jgi:hypothetical protein
MDVDEAMDEVVEETATQAESPMSNPVVAAIMFLYSKLCVIRNMQNLSGEQKMVEYYSLVRTHLIGTGVEAAVAHERAMTAAALMGGVKTMTRMGSVVEMSEAGSSSCCDG